MTHKTKIIKNSTALMGGRGYHSVLNLIAIGLIARYLGVERFGKYGFVMAVCTIFMVLTDMGTNTISIREMSRNLSKANDILWATSFIKFLLSFITFGCIALTINILTKDPEMISAAYICAAAVICFFWGDIFSAIFVAFERMVYVALLTSIQITTYLLFIIVFIQFDLGLKGIFIALLFSYFARLCCGIFMTCKGFFKPKPSLDLALCYYLIKEGFPIGINRVLRKTSFRIDTVLIKIMRSLAEVGIFHGAYRIILVLTLIPQSITQALFPMMSRLASESIDSLSILMERSFKLLLIFVIPLVMTLILFSKEVIRLILGNSYLQAVPALVVFALIWGIMFFNDLFVRLLNASNRQSLATRAVAICLIVNFFADIVLIYVFGYFGAVIATLMAEAALFAGTYHFVSKNIGPIAWRRTVLRPLLAGASMAVVMYALNPISRILAAFSGLGTFLGCLLILQTFDPQEMAMIKVTLQKVHHRFSCLFARQY